MRRHWLRPLAALLMTMALLGSAPGAATAHDGDPRLKPSERAVLRQYAADTWESFVALADTPTGLPADNINADTRERSGYTSPTNIGVYIWATLVARDLQLIKPGEARERIGQTLDTLATLERHDDSGQFYNWYSPTTGEKLTVWPVDGGTVYPFLSSVDNGWLASALIMVTNSVPQLRDEARALVDSMDFGFYYDKGAGLIRGGFWDELPPGCSTPGNYRDPVGSVVYYTCHHYGALNTEPRIASYIGIAKDGIPATHYFKMWRTFPNTCDWSWPETRPEGETHTYLGVNVFEGHYSYRGMDIVPSWGGSMFEALMVPLLVPEEEWGEESWGVNHPLYVQAQIEHGLEEARYGYWGFSPSNNPDGGYREYGVDAIGMEPNGYASDQQRTYVDYGWNDPACPRPASIPADYGDGVVTPHASFLALDFAPEAALENLAKLRENFDAYGWGGFYDAIEIADEDTPDPTPDISRYYLALDQGMIMAAIGNELRNDRLQHYFTRGAIEDAIEPLLEMEEFTAGS
jgi:hypothetical protein